MPVNGLSVGRDYALGYYDANTGTVVELGDVQNFKAMAQKHDISSRPYNDVPKFGYIPDGYKLSFTITRTGSALEDFQLAANARFNAGSVQKAGFINEKITNPDGTEKTYQYTGVVLFVTELGDVSREKTITMQIEGMASDKRPIS